MLVTSLFSVLVSDTDMMASVNTPLLQLPFSGALALWRKKGLSILSSSSPKPFVSQLHCKVLRWHLSSLPTSSTSFLKCWGFCCLLSCAGHKYLWAVWPVSTYALCLVVSTVPGKVVLRTPSHTSKKSAFNDCFWYFNDRHERALGP